LKVGSRMDYSAVETMLLDAKKQKIEEDGFVALDNVKVSRQSV